ncbi:sensor domain-containing diguanylate cyclase [Thiorhodovibrio frisius]|uniref:diguanylate cyclase n=1 Tax=Thiorhodovibrio frisius TaxID=631362 RepID=H8YYS8_9GAMM|nr:diguanylate cyclase [Thiorhodovibrio frisius]EIC23604.1 PAS domain S-box/diguanylate cyclase (GGDEF) domain-containing protein [Thiorhodovibrio frisius]
MIQTTHRPWENEVLDLLLDAVCIVDAEGRFTYVNGACETIFGYTREELIGQPMIDLVLPEDREQTKQAATKVMEGTPTLRFENRYRRKDGRIIELSWTASWSESLGVRIGVARDMTERKRADEALADAKEQLERSNRSLQEANEMLQRLATTDHLTDIENRWSFENRAQIEISRAQRYGEHLSVILFDIDHFKAINDQFGHLIGDQVIIEITKRVGRNLRMVDMLARWGGEEFAVILPNCRLSDAALMAEKLRALIADEAFTHVGQVTSSFGVAEWAPQESLDQWIKHADNALYAAKAAGRNSFCVHKDRPNGAHES